MFPEGFQEEASLQTPDCRTSDLQSWEESVCAV